MVPIVQFCIVFSFWSYIYGYDLYLFLLNCKKIYREMDLKNDPNENQEAQNQNDQQRNVANEIHEGLETFRDLSH